MPGDSELRILLNPGGLGGDIALRFLAQCFGRGWTRTTYRWYLERSFGAEPPDRVILADGERVVAGCGLGYRLLRTTDGTVHMVSIVVAAGTVPSERGRGHYARVLQAAIERSAQRGCTAVLGFVTAHNATGRGLRRLGAIAVPSAYIASPARARAPGTNLLTLRHVPVTDGWRARAAARFGNPPHQAGFYYPDARSWRSQLLERPHPVQSLRVGASCRALIESVGDTDRLQWLDGDPREYVAAIRSLAAHAQARQRHFFMYSTRAGDPAATQRLGLVARPGFMMVLAPAARHEATVRPWAAQPWHVQSGDRL